MSFLSILIRRGPAARPKSQVPVFFSRKIRGYTVAENRTPNLTLAWNFLYHSIYNVSCV
jgi:hypothetical protein